MAMFPGSRLSGGVQKKLPALLGLMVSLSLVCILFGTAQAQTVQKSTRKLVRSIPPEYPSIVKHAHVGGLVRLRVTVLPNGDVTKVESIGGNPIFLESATKAVMKWKYTPAAARTEEDLEINFNPD